MFGRGRHGRQFLDRDSRRLELVEQPPPSAGMVGAPVDESDSPDRADRARSKLGFDLAKTVRNPGRKSGGLLLGGDQGDEAFPSPERGWPPTRLNQLIPPAQDGARGGP